jgi:hypothetical protein
MATNFFFNNFQNSGEQTLIEDLIIESIRIYGLDMYFIPRNASAIDKIYGEDPTRYYTSAIPVEMYIKNIEGFAGEGDFLSKFNIQIRDQITFSIARRVWDQEVGVLETKTRPNEGDLIFLPLNRKLFEIKFVEHEAIFYQLGSLQMYDLKCELFEYNNEYIKTGIDEVDALMLDYSMSQEVSAGIFTESGLFINDEDGYSLIQESFDINTNNELAENDEFETEADSFVIFTERDPFSEGVSY